MGKSRIYRITERRKFKEDMAISPVLSHAYSLRQSRVVPPYVRALILLSTIQHFGIPSLIT